MAGDWHNILNTNELSCSKTWGAVATSQSIKGDNVGYIQPFHFRSTLVLARAVCSEFTEPPLEALSWRMREERFQDGSNKAEK
jgi:hypothetical protein